MRRLQWVGWFVVVGIAALSLGPQFDPGGPEQATDKVLHAGAYGVAALAFVAGRAPAGPAAGALVAFGGALELAQLALPHRSSETADLLANLLGVAAGAALGRLAARADRSSPER